MKKKILKTKEDINDHLMCPIHPKGHGIYITIGGIFGAMAKDYLYNKAKKENVCIREADKNY